MVADQFVVLTGAALQPGLQPLGEPLVQIGALPFGGGLVGAVAQQHVQEPERLDAGQVGPVRMHQFLADQAQAVGGDHRLFVRVRQVDDGVEVEAFPHDGGAFKDPPFGRVEPVEPGREQGRDGRRHRHVAQAAGGDPPAALPAQQAVVDEGRHHLLDEQWVAGRGGSDPGDEGRVEVVGAHQGADQALAACLGQRRQQHRGGVEFAASPVPPLLQQFRAGQAQQHDEGVAGPVGDVLQQVEQGRLGPVHVVEPQDQRASGRQRLEEGPDGPEALLRTEFRAAQPHQGRERLDDLRRLGDTVEQFPQPTPPVRGALVGGQTGGLAHHLHQRPVGDALAVGQATPGEHGRPVRHGRAELADHPGLADARRAQHGEQVAGAFLDHGLEGVLQPAAFPVTPDDRGGEAVGRGPAAGTRGRVDQPDQSVHPQRVALALDDQGAERAHRDAVPDEAVGGVPDEDLVRGSGVFQPGGDVHRIAGDATAGDGHLAGVDPDPHPQFQAPLALQVGVERLHRRPDVEGGATRAQRVVLVQHGNAEDGEDGVANELLDRPAVGVDHFTDGGEEPPHDLLQRFGVDSLADVGGPGDVHEHDRHGFPGAAPRGGKGIPTSGAEARPLGVVLRAGRARHHMPDGRPIATRGGGGCAYPSRLR